jgi:hypothetical protein
MGREVKKYVVVDIDGTVSIVGDRVRHLSEKPCNWDGFYSRCSEDEPNITVVELVRNLLLVGYGIVYMSGRRDTERFDTEMWLSAFGIESNLLFMRKAGDFRHDTEIKPELMKQFQKEVGCTNDDIAFILEDRNSMVKKWRELGFTCLQVAEGDF